MNKILYQITIVPPIKKKVNYNVYDNKNALIKSTFLKGILDNKTFDGVILIVLILII